METLNSDIKNISDTRVKENESMVNKTKEGITGLIANLLADFSKRVEELEKELKSDLDDHVDRHHTIANDLKPRMEQILEKYLERMDKIVVDLKERISNLLKEHLSHLKNTTDSSAGSAHTRPPEPPSLSAKSPGAPRDSVIK